MTTLSPHKLDELTPHQLIDEVKQIAEQYSREVTTLRRTWPKSVRERVLALARLGVPRARIGKECGIPIATVSLWCKQILGRKRSVPAALKPSENSGDGRFLALAGSDTCHSHLTVGIGIAVEGQKTLPAVVPGLQILLPGGVEVRGLTSLEQVLVLYRACRS